MVELLLLASASVGSLEPQLNCENPGPQQEMNHCAHQDYLKADAEMNAQWKKTTAAMKEQDAGWTADWDERSGFFDTLLEAQRAWLEYRDAHCASEGYIFRGGTMEPFMVSTCKTALTEERTGQLRELVEVEE